MIHKPFCSEGTLEPYYTASVFMSIPFKKSLRKFSNQRLLNPGTTFEVFPAAGGWYGAGVLVKGDQHPRSFLAIRAGWTNNSKSVVITSF